MTVLVTLGIWNEGCFLTSAPSFRLELQLADVLIQHGHRENIITPLVLIPRKPRCSKKTNISPAGPPPFLACGCGSVPTANPKQVHLSSTKTNVVTDKKTSPPTPTMPFPGD
jgi:hypothetical protein